MALTPGQNASLGSPQRVVVKLTPGSGSVDPVVLLLDASDRADDDNGVVLFSNPSAADGAVELESGGAVRVDAAALPAAIQRVLIVAQADGTPTVQTNGSVRAIVTADQAPGIEVMIDALPAVETLQVCELYRRGGDWKVRALGDGYADGLAKLLTVHGIVVSDAPATPAAPTPAPAAPAPPAVVPVNLSKPRLPESGKVNLTKRQGVSLTKQSGAQLKQITMGLGWDPSPRLGSIDLDASCVMLDASGAEVDSAWYGGLRSRDGSVRHSGDNLTGAGDGDDEQIVVDLDRVPASVRTLVFTVNSYSGHKFNDIRRAFCRLLDERGVETVRYELSDMPKMTGLIVCALARGNDGWEMTALGEGAKGSTYRKMISEITAAARSL